MLRFICLFAFLFQLFFSASWAEESPSPKAQALTPITLQLMWKHQFEFAGFYAAQAKGFYRDIGLDVTFREYKSGDNIVDEVVSGRAQYGVNDSSLIISRSEGKPVVLLSNIFQHSPIVLITKSDSGITSPAQMVGKKVMIAEHERNNVLITAMLNKESVSLDQVEIIKHSFNVDDLINNKVDVMSAYATNEPSVLKQKNIPINIIRPINYGIDFYGNNLFTSEQVLTKNPKQTKDFVAASLKGWQYALDHPDEIIELILKKYSQVKSRQLLRYEANALRQYILPKFIPLGTIDDLRMQRIVKTYQEQGLLEKTYTLKGFLSTDYIQQNSFQKMFDPDEIAWIQLKKELTLGVDPNWYPFEFLNERGEYAGMAADFIQLISQRTGLAIKLQKNDSWGDVISSAKNKALDVLPAVMKSDQREDFLDFTLPYINYPMVILTAKDSSFVSELNDLKGKTVVVVKDYVTEDLLRQNHPTLQLITAKNIDQALTIVANGDATAFVDNLATITTAISKGGFNNLRISATTKYRFELSLAVPKGETTLLNILQKTLDSISADEIATIKSKWISLKYEKEVDYSIVYKIVASAALIIFVIFLWNRRLAHEINSRILAEKKAHDSEQRFRMLFEDNNAVELIIDPNNGLIIEANNAAQTFYGYSLSQMQLKNINDINVLSEQEVNAEIQLAHEQERKHYYFKHKLANGDIRDVEVHSGPVQWDNKELLYSIIHDVTKEKKLQQKLSEKASELEYHATHDALTGLINRREFEIRMDKAIAYCTLNNDCNKSILALDLDNFKIVNDTAGHAIGDDVLIKISALMSSKVRNRDTFARLGGDEFGVLLDNCSISDAEDIAQSIIKAVKNFQYKWSGSTFHLGVSIGITQIKGELHSMDETLNQVDAACYEAKRMGRNRYEVYSEAITSLAKRTGERWWTNEIISAIEENRFCLYHQIIAPIKNSNEGKNFEVLLRLHDISGNLIFPDNFIPPAEQYNLMPAIDRWVIDNVFLWLAFHPIVLNELNKCSINLSGQSMVAAGFYEYVMKKFIQHGIPAHKICWEITETAAIADFDLAKDFIAQMRAFGCSFSLDDFGTGLSSFNYLKHLEVDYIKIDGSFITDILNNQKDQLIAESVHTISQGLGMKTIAEFVENDQIKQRLLEIGIDYAQGYGIHKPSPLK